MLLNGHLQEVNWFKERYRAWFVGDNVIDDGGLYLCTPVDPLLMALPLLEASRKEVKTISSHPSDCGNDRRLWSSGALNCACIDMGWIAG